MKISEAKPGRVFIIRLEDGEILHECIERFAGENKVIRAALVALGGADTGSKLVVGPAEGRARPVRPMEYVLDNVHEVAGVGTIFPGTNDKPVLHMHLSCGRAGTAKTGCVRRGVKVWHVLEVVVFELLNDTARRTLEESLGFELLQP